MVNYCFESKCRTNSLLPIVYGNQNTDVDLFNEAIDYEGTLDIPETRDLLVIACNHLPNTIKRKTRTPTHNR